MFERAGGEFRRLRPVHAPLMLSVRRAGSALLSGPHTEATNRLSRPHGVTRAVRHNPVGLTLLALAAACGASPGDSGRSRSSVAAPITQSSPAWAKLAVIHTGSPQPPEDVLARFRTAFDRLAVHCPDPSARVGDFIVAGQRQLAQRGKRTSLLELTEAVATMLDTAAVRGGFPKMASCAEPVTLIVVAFLPR